MNEKTRAEELAKSHWGYVEETANMHAFAKENTYSHEHVMALCKHHYITAAIHFHGHGVEDERNRIFKETTAHKNTITRCIDCGSDPCPPGSGHPTECIGWSPRKE